MIAIHINDIEITKYIIVMMYNTQMSYLRNNLLIIPKGKITNNKNTNGYDIK